MNTLYRFYNAAGELLYIGLTTRLPQRFRDHRQSKEWWSQVARIELQHYETHGELVAAEVNAIRQEHPRHNVANTTNGRRRREPPTVPLWAVRQVTGITVEELQTRIREAAGVHISVNKLLGIEAGTVPTNSSNLALIAAGLDIPAAELVVVAS